MTWCVGFLTKLNKKLSEKHTEWSRYSGCDYLDNMINVLGELWVSVMFPVCMWPSGWGSILQLQSGDILSKRTLHIVPSTQDAMAKYYRLGNLNRGHLFSHRSEGWKSKIVVPV